SRAKQIGRHMVFALPARADWIRPAPPYDPWARSHRISWDRGIVNTTLAATATRWRGVLAPLKGERVITHNLIVVGGTVLAGMLGVAFQSLVSHQLQPAAFGGVFAVITLITLIGLPASGFTLLMARETSRDKASGHCAFSSTLLRRGNVTLVIAGGALGGAIVILSPILAAW